MQSDLVQCAGRESVGEAIESGSSLSQNERGILQGPMLTVDHSLPPTSGHALARVHAIEERMRACSAKAPETHVEHVLHAGMYARTIRCKGGQAFASVTIRPGTILIVNGWASITNGDYVLEIKGYKVIPASAGRKAIWLIREDTEITAIFPTEARTIAAAEAEFTTEPEKLSELTENDLVVITGEPCLA